MEVLRSPDEIAAARAELRRRGLSCLTGSLTRKLRNRHVLPGVNVGHYLKSWDVLRTALFIEARLEHSAPVLDLGSYASEIPCVLRRLGYSQVHGVDLDPRVRGMPYRRSIHYAVGNYLSEPPAAEQFAAVIAVSSIEHGFDAEKLFARVSSLLRPGGYFIASFDYWPEKIDTRDIRMFDMDWRIFSRDEVLELIEVASSFGLHGGGVDDTTIKDPPIAWAGRRYTFAWLALRKQ